MFERNTTQKGSREEIRKSHVREHFPQARLQFRAFRSRGAGKSVTRLGLSHVDGLTGRMSRGLRDGNLLAQFVRSDRLIHQVPVEVSPCRRPAPSIPAFHSGSGSVALAPGTGQSYGWNGSPERRHSPWGSRHGPPATRACRTRCGECPDAESPASHQRPWFHARSRACATSVRRWTTATASRRGQTWVFPPAHFPTHTLLPEKKIFQVNLFYRKTNHSALKRRAFKASLMIIFWIVIIKITNLGSIFALPTSINQSINQSI